MAVDLVQIRKLAETREDENFSFRRFLKTECNLEPDEVDHADLAGLTPRHNHYRLVRNQDDGAGVLAVPAKLGWVNQFKGLLRVGTIGIRSRRSPQNCPDRREKQKPKAEFR